MRKPKPNNVYSFFLARLDLEGRGFHQPERKGAGKVPAAQIATPLRRPRRGTTSGRGFIPSVKQFDRISHRLRSFIRATRRCKRMECGSSLPLLRREACLAAQ
jgi:hypothetical protein